MFGFNEVIDALLHSLYFACPVFRRSRTFRIGFRFAELPAGKSVTLPHPATTNVPLEIKVRLTATDHRQTLKLSSIGRHKAPFTVAIYDQNSEKVRYLKLSQGGSIVYNFKDLRPIQVVPLLPKGGAARAWLQVSSNRPLTIAR